MTIDAKAFEADEVLKIQKETLMKIAVVGANRGIGLEFVKVLAKDHDVYAFCRKASTALSNVGAAQIIEGCDVSRPSSLADSVDRLSAPQLDWLIHVSGIMESTSLDNFDEAALERQFRVNAMGPIFSAKSFLPKMAASGKIGLLTSRMGSIADNGSGGAYGYRMSKAALNCAGVSLAQDISDTGVTVLLLHPGYVKTDMTKGSGNIDAAESVDGLIRIMTEKSLSDTGTFWHTNGEPLPW